MKSSSSDHFHSNCGLSSPQTQFLVIICICDWRLGPLFSGLREVEKVLFKSGNPSTWRRQWHPTPVLLPGKSHGQRNLIGCSPWGHEELDTTVRLHFHFSLFMHWRRKWQPTPVFLPGISQGRGSLVGCHLWGRTESDTTDALAAAAAATLQQHVLLLCLC